MFMLSGAVVVLAGAVMASGPNYDHHSLGVLVLVFGLVVFLWGMVREILSGRPKG